MASALAAAAAAAAAAGIYVHPISDATIVKMHKEKHEGACDETWPTFVLHAENFCDEIDALYCLTLDPITRANQLITLGHPQVHIDINQNRVFSFFVHGTAHYAGVEIEDVGRGSPNSGSNLFAVLCLRHNPGDGPARVSKKEALTFYCQTSFTHDSFNSVFTTFTNSVTL